MSGPAVQVKIKQNSRNLLNENPFTSNVDLVPKNVGNQRITEF